MKGSGGNRNKKGIIKTLVAVIVTITAIFGLANSKTIMSFANKFLAAGDIPAHEKTKTDNEINGQKDGTYKLSLTVKGEAEKQVTKANVIVIVDRSNSMDSSSGTGAYVASDDNDSTMYGLIDGEYKRLTRRSSGSGWSTTYTYWYNDTQYTGQRYEYDSTASRLQATKAAINGLANSLLSYNGKDGNPNDTVEMALVQFGTRASTRLAPTTSADTYINSVNGILTADNTSGETTYGGATNWEDALRQANTIDFGDTDPTYVIFFSDGAPTVRNTNNGHNDTYNHTGYTQYYGTGSEKDQWGNLQTNNMNWAYAAAVDDATTLANKVGTDRFFTIFAYGETYGATYMSNLTTAAGAPATNNYSASSTSELEAAFAEILENIQLAGIGSAVIDDGTTNKVEVSGASAESKIVSLLEIDKDSFEYFKTNKDTGEYETWTKPNEEGHEDLKAKVEDGHVIWDISSEGILENGITYKVSFDVYPSQTTYDYIADLENGVIEYSNLPKEVKQYLIQDCTLGTKCSYTLATNTTATLSYDDTRDAAETQTVPYTNPDPVPTKAATISISKEWDNTIDSRDKNEVKVKLLKSKDDGTGFEDFCFNAECEATLNDDNEYELDNISIATGLARLKDGKLTVLDKGHDYKFDELGSESYYWQLETEVVHPMIINGVLTKLIKVEDESIISQMGTATYKTIGGKTYYQLSTGKVYVDAGEGPNIKAENHRRSNLNITKVVDGPTADPDEEFTFTINVVQKDDQGNVIPSTDTTNHNDYLWFSIMDASGKSVTLDKTPTGWTLAGTSYYAPNETSLTVKLKAGYNLRFFNLHTGTTFTVTETNVSDYKLDQLKETEEYKTTKDGDLITNTIQTVKDSNTLSGTITGNNRTYTVEATNIYEKVNAKVKKEWPDDNNNAEGLRKPITFKLKDSKGNVVDTITLDGTVDNNGETAPWEGEFAPQSRFVNGEEETYYVEEDLTNIKDHYTSSVSPEEGVANDGLVTVTNRRIPTDLTTKVEGKKTWIDGPEDNPSNNQDQVRPTSITVYLYANGDEVDYKPVEVDKETGEWKYEFNNLPKYANGDLIVYSVTEALVPYYEAEYDGYNITNTHTPFTTEVSVTKVWSDGEDIDGIRPDHVTVQLYAGELAVDGQSVQLSDSNNWTWTFTKLPRKLAGKDIEYSVKEVPVPTGYTATYKDEEKGTKPADDSTNFDSKPLWTVTNTHTPETTEVSVEKVWDDEDDQDGIRPDSVQVQLYKDGTASGDPVTLDESNDWKTSWTGLAKYEFNEKGEGGKLVDYTIEEIKTGKITGTDGHGTYAIAITGDATQGYTVTNTHTPDKTEVSVTKAWDDASNQDGIRPDDVQVQLYADGKASGDPITLNSENKWTYTWSGLEKNKNVNGTVSEIIYTVDETPVPTSYSKEITGDATTGYTITNKYTPGVTQVSVTKAWDDKDDQDGIRPASVQVQLLADGTAKGEAVTLNSENKWTYTWSELPEKASGEAIEYTVEEIKTDVINGTDAHGTYAIAVTGDATKGYTITNTHTPDETEVSVTKAWDDEDDQDGIRPASVQVQLLADGTAKGDPITLNSANKWTYTWDKLAVNASGEAIEYTVEEVKTSVITGTDAHGTYAIAVTGDAAKGYTITNTHTPDETEVSVTKAWNDEDDQDGIRPASVQVQLLADGKASGNPITLNSDNSWTYTWDKLAVNASGEAIEYTVEEVKTSVITGTDAHGTYAIAITGDAAKGYTVTNKHTPDETEVSVTKAWDDKDDQDGFRPASVQVQLLADGTAKGEAITLNSENKWTYTWDKLAVNASGEAIEYTVEEVKTSVITGTDGPGTYAIAITGDATEGYTVTNTHTPEKIEVPVEKVWSDAQDQDGIRPDSIEVQLFADKKAQGEAVTLNSDNSWKYTWTKLDKYKDGKEIAYTVDETEVPTGYSKESITGDVKQGFKIKNTHVTEDTAVKVTKVWEDANDQDGIRPTSVQVQLLADGEAHGEVVTLNSENNWTKTWSGLDKFKDGDEIVYTVEELTTDVITGRDAKGTYKFEITGDADTEYTVTNTHTPETTTISGSKTWDDKGNQDGLRPSKIKINLLADGEVIKSEEFAVDSKTGECNYSFTDLPRYKVDETTGKGGKEIVYTITEDRVKEYDDPSYNGLDVTNKHNPFETVVSVKKNWEDAKDIDGKRPTTITVRLYADGIAQGELVTLDESNDWSKTWSNLPRKASGKDIVYTVKELIVPEGYTSNVEDPDKEDTPTTTLDGTTYTSGEEIKITNDHKPETTKVSVEKVWDDKENQDGLRPASVEIQLLADGQATDYFVVLSEQNKWNHTWENLPKYEFDEKGNGGQEIEYTVKETEVPDKYTATVTGTAKEGFKVTNSYTPEETSLKITKVWDDKNDQDGKRPASIQVQLTADGTAQGEPVTLDESNSWTYTWTKLAKNKNVTGESVAIQYAADEVAVPKDYQKTTTGDMASGITVTNRYTPEVTTVEGTKTWEDFNNVDGKRPASITVYVKDGETIVETITVTGDATAESWTFKSKDLPKYRNHGNEKINYTVEEETTELTKIGYSTSVDGTTITNSRKQELVEEFPITKTWIDNSNSEGFRPNSVDIQLLADGKPYGDPITVGTDKDGNPLEGTTIDGNNWKYVFKNLPKHTHDENGNGGKEIVYSIKEVNLDTNYKAEIVDNRTIVNTIDSMKKNIPVKKAWDDASNQDGYRPDSIEFTLTGTVPGEENPVHTDKITLTGEKDEWEGTFVDAPTFYKGTLITYTINEVVTKDLETYYKETKEEIVDGVYKITNKHTPEVTQVTIGKTWDDKDNQDGKRPASIEVTLTGNDKTYGPVRIGLDENGNPLEGTEVEGNTWKYTFTDLPKKANGKDIDYVVSENEVDYYNQLSIISNVITNQHVPAKISYYVEKEWNDYDNQDGKRPDFITVTLTGKVGETVVYTETIKVEPDENDDWKYEFEGLDKYNNGQLIQYTLTEGNVQLYETDPIVDIPNEEGTTSISNKITNNHELETIDITVKKVWDDLDNKYNHRTTFVTVHLFADGEEVDTAILSEANGWTAIFEGFGKYREGKVGEEIEYTITEDTVEYYKNSIAKSDNVFTITNTYDGPTESEIVPPNTGIVIEMSKNKSIYELLMILVTLGYTITTTKKVEE